jgi:hypothetical protein
VHHRSCLIGCLKKYCKVTHKENDLMFIIWVFSHSQFMVGDACIRKTIGSKHQPTFLSIGPKHCNRESRSIAILDHLKEHR